MSIFTFPEENSLHTPASYRKSAMQSQLLSLNAQVRAIHEIAREHGFLVEDLNPDAIVKRLEDLVESAKDWIDRSSEVELPKLLQAIRSLRQTSDQLRTEAQEFVDASNRRAQFRMSGIISSMLTTAHDEPIVSAEDPSSVSQHERLVPQGVPLAAAAGRRCYRAESEQHATFALQVNAICDLVMEDLLASASKAAPFNI